MLLITTQSFAIKDPPLLLRACLNSQDSIITISWKPPSDVCSSFTHYSLFASSNGGTFTKIATIPLLMISEYPHKLNNSSTKWQYFIRIFTLCDGLDSLQSTTLDVDVNRPQEIQLDSVSYDLTTQDIVAGWSPNPSVDTKLYKIYNFSSGNGDSIGVTTNTSFTVSPNPAQSFPVVLATLDSCNLSSQLSAPHTPVTLNGFLDSCKRQISLTWDLYRGWDAIDSQVVFVSINNSPFYRYAKVSSSDKDFTYNNLTLGDKLSIFIRSYTEAGDITSSSNQLTFATRKPIVPLDLYLANVTVNNGSIELLFRATSFGDATELVLYRGETPISLDRVFSRLISGPTIDYIYTDLNAASGETRYFYQIEARDRCSSVLASSNISSNILLQSDDLLRHNPYDGWLQGVVSYELQYSSASGSTWNTIEASIDPFKTNVYLDSSGCFRVRAFETPNSIFNPTAISYSNITCLEGLMTSYIVTAVNPSGSNNRFVVVGTGINHSISYYQIYNRWGELLHKSTTSDSWDLTYNGETIPSGKYIYVVTLYGVAGENRTEKGTLNVIK